MASASSANESNEEFVCVAKIACIGGGIRPSHNDFRTTVPAKLRRLEQQGRINTTEPEKAQAQKSPPLYQQWQRGGEQPKIRVNTAKWKFHHTGKWNNRQNRIHNSNFWSGKWSRPGGDEYEPSHHEQPHNKRSQHEEQRLPRYEYPERPRSPHQGYHDRLPRSPEQQQQLVFPPSGAETVQSANTTTSFPTHNFPSSTSKYQQGYFARQSPIPPNSSQMQQLRQQQQASSSSNAALASTANVTALN
ncbi:uncharacterized protein LOC134527501 [Bacillus rossius redtenbacheri]|uniref:uncharacterized protein LOC134527501 n=1 Tax=Bacillus rossius redtenbacheri TaxID=93214 RepID=UPI002FDDB7AF